MSNEAKSQYFFLYGLEQYLKEIQHPELWRFKEIRQAIIYGDPYKIRNLMVNEVYRGPVNQTDEYIKALMTYYLEDDEYNARRVLQYTSQCIEDHFLKNSHRWCELWQHKIDINQQFNKPKIEATMWAARYINKILELRTQQGYPITTVAEFAGNYGMLAYHLLNDNQNIKQLISVDSDAKCVKISDTFNDHDNYHDWRFKAVCSDINRIKWNDRNFKVKVENNKNKQTVLNIGPQLIVNIHAQKMRDTWFKKLPKDMVVCVMTSDQKSNSTNTNCVKNLDHAIKKYNFTRVYYSDTLVKKTYNKFIIIGRT